MKLLARSPRTLVSVLVVTATLVFGHLAGAAAEQIAPGPPVTFTDSSGDSGTAPDITTVVVSNDANGRIDFEIDVPGQPGLRPDCLLFLVMDTDNNPATGAPNTEGGDYYFAMYGDDMTYGFYRWNGSDWADMSSGTETVSWSSGAHIAFDRSQIGSPDEVTFYVKTLQGSGDSEDGRVDFAPDVSTWTYVLPQQLPPPGSPTITSKRVLAVPSGTARAGKPLTVRVTLRLVVGGQTYIVGPEQLVCAAKVAGHRVKTTVKPSPLAWSCGLVVPKTARGKALTVSLKGATTVSTDAGDVSTNFAKSMKLTVH